MYESDGVMQSKHMYYVPKSILPLIAMLDLVDCISWDAISETASSETISCLSTLCSKLTDCVDAFGALYTAMKSTQGSDLRNEPKMNYKSCYTGKR